jgi:hypothetical protein
MDDEFSRPSRSQGRRRRCRALEWRADGHDVARTGHGYWPGTQQQPSSSDHTEDQQDTDHSDMHPTESLFRQLPDDLVGQPSPSLVSGLGRWHRKRLRLLKRRCPRVTSATRRLPGQHQRQSVADQSSELKIRLRSLCHAEKLRMPTVCGAR